MVDPVTNSEPEEAGDTLNTPTLVPGERLLNRVRQVAQDIEGRVRHALNPADVPVSQLRVLVVDDNQDSADSLAAVLELLSCSVRACYDGHTALAIAAEFEPHICLLDLMMPSMDGLELATHLKARAGARPQLLIATTALGDWEMKTRTALVGFHHHFTKPVDIPTLLDAIVQMGERIAAMGHQAPAQTDQD
jgi:two-component system, OmpR family, response regulator